MRHELVARAVSCPMVYARNSKVPSDARHCLEFEG